MYDILSLHPRGFGAEDADRFYALPHVRAVAHTRFGSGKGGFVMARVASFDAVMTSSAETLSTSTDLTCLDPALCAVLVPLIPSKYPSTMPPALYNLFALVEVAGGVQRGYSAHLRTLDEAPDGVQEAMALLLGMEDAHFLLEVVGDDLIEVTNRLLTLTDHGDVVGVRSFVVPQEHTRGFGVALEAKPAATTVRKTARKGAARSRRG